MFYISARAYLGHPSDDEDLIVLIFRGKEELFHTYNYVENGGIPKDRGYDHDSEGYVPETLDSCPHVILRVLRTLNEVIMIRS